MADEPPALNALSGIGSVADQKPQTPPSGLAEIIAGNGLNALSAIPPMLPAGTTYDFPREDLERYFMGTWKLMACDICQLENQWSSESTYPFVVLPLSDGKTFTTMSPIVRVYLTVHCNNCGNTKFLLAPTIRRWLETHPA